MGMANMIDYETCIGSFVEKSVGLTHEYSLIEEKDKFHGWGGAWHMYKHKLWIREDLWTQTGYRYALIKKTVAYIVVDEDDAGLPVIEKWDIKQHYKYTPMGCVKA